MARLTAFPGRVVFDHLPKTAGQAVNAWLMQALGNGCVTPNLIGAHQRLIQQYGGSHSIISAHIHFSGEGLDPRYQYLTLVREPIDRAISWLFFVVKNHDAEKLPELWQSAENFIASDGEVLDEKLRGSIQNPYVEHFANLLSTDRARTDQQKIDDALMAIEEYDVWGLYSEMPFFLADVAALVGLPAPGQIERVNVTQSRPAVEGITPVLRQRLEASNALDIEFYKRLCLRLDNKRNPRGAQVSVAPFAWQPYNPVRERSFTAPSFTLRSISLEGGHSFTQGQLLCFQLDFSLENPASELEVGIHIWDEHGLWAFGTNTTLLERRLYQVQRGTHRLRYYVVADLPGGAFTAGFAFVDKGCAEVRELAWYDKLVAFDITVSRLTPSVGYVSLPVDMHCMQMSAAVAKDAIGAYSGEDRRMSSQVGVRDGLAIHSTGESGFLLYGPYLPLSLGSYRVRLLGSASDTQGLWMDICANKGTRVLARHAWGDAGDSVDLVVLPFEVSEPVADLEVRLWVTATAQVRIDMLWIESVDAATEVAMQRDDGGL